MLSALFPHVAQTGSVIVRAAVSFQSAAPEGDDPRWFWVYHIRIENHGDSSVQLIDRKWEISDLNGALHFVEGAGVVGEQPVIAPGASFDYVSGCPLSTPSGTMRGRYGMMDGSGRRFDVEIPLLQLATAATEP